MHEGCLKLPFETALFTEYIYSEIAFREWEWSLKD